MSADPPRPGRSGVDAQAARVYAAEDHVIDRIGRRLTRWAHVQAYLDEILADDRFHEAFEHAPLEIAIERRSRSATASLADVEHGVIWVRDGSWNVLTLLHELAHVAARANDHGPVFVAAELELVRRFCGFDAYVELSRAFDDHDVRR